MMYHRQARVPPEAWNLFTHILNRRYYEFTEKNELDEGEVPIIKIGFYRKKKVQSTQINTINLLETKRIKVNTILETKRYNISKSKKLEVDKNRILYEEEKRKLGEENEEKEMLIMMNSIMNDYSCLTTYDIIEEQILYEEVSKVTLPVEFIFEEDIKTITNEFGCQTDMENDHQMIKKELEDVLQMTSLPTSPNDIKTLSKHHLVISFLTNFRNELIMIISKKCKNTELAEVKVGTMTKSESSRNQIVIDVP
jgi:hypothetical protein